MKIKSYICIFCVLLMAVTPFGSIASAVEEEVQTIGPTVLETDEDAHSMLGSDIIFMTSNGMFYANGEKLAYSDYGEDAYLDGECVMVDVDVLSYALGIDAAVSGGKLTVGGNEFDVTVKNAANFVDAAEVAHSMGKYVYDTDNRGFILISDTNRNYTNHTLSEENQEDIDLIWRFMQFDRPSGEELYETLKSKAHNQNYPRIFVKKGEIQSLKNRINNDAYMKTVLNSVIDRSTSLLDTDPVERVVESNSIFNCANDVKENLFYLCTSYLLTENQDYAARAWAELDNVCNWVDWNITNNFLGAGEMVTGIAYAYDVLHDYLTETQRESVRERITALYIDYCVDVYEGETTNYKAVSYRSLQTNWGAVCGASMFTLSLAFIDEEAEDSTLTQKCKFLLENSLQNFEYLATVLAPYGTWYEGMGYYEYVQQHLGWVLEALDNVFGEDYSFLSVNGMREFPMFAMYYQTVNGSFNKADTTGNKMVFAPAAMIYARLYNEPELMGLYNNFRKTIGINSFLPQYLLFYDPTFAVVPEKNTLPLDKYYETIGTGIIRGSWTDTESLYTAISGGRTIEVNDSHYDKGSFVFESLGERWSLDLGRNANNQMPFVKRTETHSALVINPDADYAGQELNQTVNAVKVESKARGAQMVYDLAPAYGSAVTGYKRGFLVSDDRNTLTVQDELILTEQSELVWNMVTKADIEISADKKSAVLTQNGKKLNITAYCSEDGWYFDKTEDMAPTGGWVDNVMSAEAGNRTFTIEEQKAFANGVKKLQLKTSGSGDVTISVKLAPGIEGESFENANSNAISAWTVPDGEKQEIIRLLDIKNGEIINSLNSIFFSARIDGDIKNIKVYANEELVQTISDKNDDCRYSFIIPKEALSAAGDMCIRVAAEYEGYTSEKSIMVNIIKEYDETDKAFVDFSAYPDETADIEEIEDALGLAEIYLSDGFGEVSKVQDLTGDCLKMNMYNSKGTVKASYIELQESISSGNIIHLSFDALTNKTNTSLTASFGADVRIFHTNGCFFDGSISYQKDKIYHIEIIADTLNGNYRIWVADENGVPVAEKRDALSAYSGGLRLTFRTYTGDDGYFLVDNLAINTSLFQQIETTKAEISDGKLYLQQSLTGNVEENGDLQHIIAFYDENDKLCTAEIAYINSKNGAIDCVRALPQDAEYVRAVLWTKDLQPVAYMKEIRQN